MRRSIALLIASAALLAASQASAGPNVQAPGKVGLGLLLGGDDGSSGEVGVSGEIFVGPTHSFEIDATARRGGGRDGGRLRVDFLFWMAPIVRGRAVDLTWFWGPGGQAYGGEFGLAAELPVGLALQFKKAPIDLAIEAVPAVSVVVPGDLPRGNLLGAVAGRYYF